MTTSTGTLLLLAAMMASSCNKRATSEPEQSQVGDGSPRPSASSHSDEPSHEELPTKVQLTAAVVQDAKIRTEPATKGVLVQTLRLPGEISADPDRSARVAAPVAGRLAAVHVQEGASVKKGDLLASLRVQDVANVRGAHAAAKARAAAVHANANRVQALAARGLAAAQELATITAEAQAIDAEVAALGEQVGVLGINSAPGHGSELALRAPIAGVVLTRNAVIGQPITADETIATIADLSEVWFLGRVFEKDLENVAVGRAAEIALNAYSKERFAGHVEYVSRQIDPTTRTLSARIRLPNRGDLLRVGLFGTAYVSLGHNEAKEASIVVSRSAVTDIGKKPVVFVRQPDGDFEVHQVTLGNAALGRVEVISGLREGEQVVFDGVFTLKSMVLKGTFAEEE